ncbi:DUF6635 family protein [Paracoccus salsus]|uniref:DUF6635 family protein n=1 Tax=Paracoccus salsus TaxID=2911061 RepID=UPI001F3B2EC4|nr:DUF6635 family protein [Paracoccus salsus]MCF3973940.1 hypothetical protein [Paracoccus salsus]
MGSSSNRGLTADGTGSPLGLGYFDSRRAMIDGFVARHFTWPGTLRLHGAALGWDILRAPVNVVLSPILVLTRIAAYLCRFTGWRGGADWLARRRILLRTSVARRVEALRRRHARLVASIGSTAYTIIWNNGRNVRQELEKMYLEITIIILSTLINGLLAMSELAIVSARPARLKLLADKGRRGKATEMPLTAHDRSAATDRGPTLGLVAADSDRAVHGPRGFREDRPKFVAVDRTHRADGPAAPLAECDGEHRLRDRLRLLGDGASYFHADPVRQRRDGAGNHRALSFAQREGRSVARLRAAGIGLLHGFRSSHHLVRRMSARQDLLVGKAASGPWHECHE